MMCDFSYHLPVHLEFGYGKLETVGNSCRHYGKKAILVISKGGSVRRNGFLEKVMASLHREHISFILFDQVTANPLLHTVYIGAAIAREKKCDIVIALGGGSTIDCAKGIAFAACNNGDLTDYIKGRIQGEKALPIIAIPTTCGTGSEGNTFAVLTDEDTHNKKALCSPCLLPVVSIVDPQVMRSMPSSVFSAVAFDALCHHMEAFLSSGCQPFVEMQSLYAIQLFCGNFFRAYGDVEDKDAWYVMSFISILGGMNIQLAGVTAPHALEHPASGLRNIIHGRGLAALVPCVFEKSISAAPHRFADLARALGGKDERDCVPILKAFLARAGLTTTLSHEGVLPSDLDWMVKNALRISRGSLLLHPKIFSKEEIKEIYMKCM
jgi:alcohol dehydrogenase class IV